MGEEFGRAPGAPDVPSHFLSYPSLPSASLVPVYSFGENDIFRVKAFAPDSWQHHLQEVPGHFSLHLLASLLSQVLGPGALGQTHHHCG